MEGHYHIPVLLNEVLDGLQIKQDGIYVDGTFGGGGHSKEILTRLGPLGKLIAFDQDEDAKKNLPKDNRILFVPHNFRHLKRFLRLHEIKAVDGVLADLGVSSHQFDEAERGFSTRFDAPLDMRMNQKQTLTAADILQNYSEAQLHKLFEQYGEVTNSKTLAKTIVQARKTTTIKSIEAFKTVIHPVVKGNPHKYLAQVFQALRIEVNDELGALTELLQQLPEVLKKGARVAIISFHSLEDRLVKNFFKQIESSENNNPFLQNNKEKIFRIITKKPLEASSQEVKQNPRARSARLRIAEFI